MDQISSAVIDLANKHLGDFKIRNGQVVAKYCPFCQGGNHTDKDTFAVGLYNGAYSCLRGNCGQKGSFRQLCEYFGESVPDAANPVVGITKQVKLWDLPSESDLFPVTEDIVTYFAIRKISPSTLEHFRISANADGDIVFPFYRSGVLTFVKYRKPKKFVKGEGPKEWQMRNTEPILFGMDEADTKQRLVITEGEIDALSLYEAGITNVVSVPCGCSNMEWVNLCWDWLEQFNQIVLFGDADEPGLQMMQNLVKRLGEDRCMIAPAYPDLLINGENAGRTCKDANEILYAYGPETLAKLLEDCTGAPMEGMLDLASVPFEDPSLLPRIYSRIPGLDQAIGGFGQGGLTVISGKRGEGKSTVVGEFALNAIQQGHNVAMFSGELAARQVLEWIMTQACESRYVSYREDERNGKRYALVPPEIQTRIRKWLAGHFWLFDNSCVDTGSMIDAVIKRFTMCARRYGCSLFIVDNLMMLTSGIEEEIKMQARITAALKQFAVRFNAHVILIAHPRKTPAGQMFNSEDISGSAAISNLADIVMSVEKPNIRVTKNREFGETPLIECDFNPANRRIYQSSIGDRTIYGWDHAGISIPNKQACDLPEFAIQTGRRTEYAANGNPF